MRKQTSSSHLNIFRGACFWVSCGRVYPSSEQVHIEGTAAVPFNYPAESLLTDPYLFMLVGNFYCSGYLWLLWLMWHRWRRNSS
ncbi:hypothetical protein Nepgr_010958 [Nepenthes gracilis]|uniref:Uncharacterized protein n=1 Tax=Nepenthes gracilis TaxID=150966 RepID=A0AAD3XLI0_NEPGR|nr:hypothetical protein Nepgr_010958 [Nepenthes gracilis]